MSTSETTVQSALPLVGRILMASIFILSGLSKLAAAAATQGYIASAGLPAPVLAYVIAVAVEAGGGLLLLVGYRTRVVAAVLAVFTLVTAVVFHHALGDQNQFIHFFKNIAIAGGLFQVATFGAGSISIDGLRTKAHRRGRALSPA